ncbi:MAG: hypothetical protein AAB036_04725 [Elusimicrobiota bacterium]
MHVHPRPRNPFLPPPPDRVSLAGALLSELERLAEFYPDASPDATRHIPCDWGARVIAGTYEGKRAYKIVATRAPSVAALVVEAGHAKDWEQARRLCSALPGRSGWRLPKSIEVVYMGVYGILKAFDFVPGVQFGLLWASGETAHTNAQMFRGTSNFISMNLATQTRRMVSLEEQMRRHLDLLREFTERGADDGDLIEARRIQSVIDTLRAGIPVYSLIGNLYPFNRGAERRVTRPRPTED